MTKATGNKKPGAPEHQALVIGRSPDESSGEAMARVLLGVSARHGHVAAAFAGPILSGAEKPGIMDCAKVVKGRGDRAAAGDLEFVSRMLAAQATTLDTMFAELARRAALNMGEYLNASEKYGRLALKAQSNCRATLEALTKLHQPREQTVRHVHVGHGGQAVVADQFHQHAGGKENGNSIKQCHATGDTGSSTALPGPDPLSGGMPISSGSREAAM